MSWCRWSTNGFRCDLYIYDSVGDFVSVNVAGRRKLWGLPEPSAFTWKTGKMEVKSGLAWKWYRVLKWLWRLHYDLTPWRDIHHEGGASHQFTDMASLAEWLIVARQKGLRFPDRVFQYCAGSVKDSTYEMAP